MKCADKESRRLTTDCHEPPEKQIFAEHLLEIIGLERNENLEQHNFYRFCSMKSESKGMQEMFTRFFHKHGYFTCKCIAYRCFIQIDGCERKAVSSVQGLGIWCDNHFKLTPTGRPKGPTSRPLNKTAKTAKSKAHVRRRCASVDKHGSGLNCTVVGVELGAAVGRI